MVLSHAVYYAGSKLLNKMDTFFACHIHCPWCCDGVWGSQLARPIWHHSRYW